MSRNDKNEIVKKEEETGKEEKTSNKFVKSEKSKAEEKDNTDWLAVQGADEEPDKEKESEPSNNEKSKSVPTEHYYALSMPSIYFLLSLYSILLVVGISIAIMQLVETVDVYLKQQDNNLYFFATSLIVSIGGAFAFSSAYYIRKIYKICIRKRLKETYEKCEKVGYIAYFVLRPFYAVLFSILANSMMLAGIFVVAGGVEYVLNLKFIVLSFIISCSIGFSIGKVLDWYTDNSYKKFKEYAGVTDGE